MTDNNMQRLNQLGEQFNDLELQIQSRLDSIPWGAGELSARTRRALSDAYMQLEAASRELDIACQMSAKDLPKPSPAPSNVDSDQSIENEPAIHALHDAVDALRNRLNNNDFDMSLRRLEAAGLAKLRGITEQVREQTARIDDLAVEQS